MLVIAPQKRHGVLSGYMHPDAPTMTDLVQKGAPQFVRIKLPVRHIVQERDAFERGIWTLVEGLFRIEMLVTNPAHVIFDWRIKQVGTRRHFEGKDDRDFRIDLCISIRSENPITHRLFGDVPRQTTVHTAGTFKYEEIRTASYVHFRPHILRQQEKVNAGRY